MRESPFLSFSGDVMKNGRTKYNVSRKKEERTFGGIVFASKLEMEYYRDVVLPAMEAGEITKCILQPQYELQPGFRRDGKWVRPIIYVADFYLEYSDGHDLVVDIKGRADSVAPLKRKLFWYKYPEQNYQWLTCVKKYGGWITWEYANAQRRAAKKKRTKCAKGAERKEA